MKKITIACMALLACSVLARADYTPEQVAAVAANTASVGTHVADMTPQEAAKFVDAVIDAIVANDALDELGKKRALADLTARVVLLAGPNAPIVMCELFEILDLSDDSPIPPFVPTITAAAVIAAGEQADAVWGCIQAKLQGDTLAGAQAARDDPDAALPDGVARDIRQIGAAGGLSAVSTPRIAQTGTVQASDEPPPPPPPPPPPY